MRSHWKQLLVIVLASFATLLSAACDGHETEPTPTAPAATKVASVDSLPSTATQTAPATASRAATPPPQASPSIVSPTGGQAVPMIITVEFDSPEPAYVLVRPNPADPNQGYWVQAEAVRTGPNRWQAYPVYVGAEADPSGLPFKVCVAITGSALSRGERLRQLPDGPSHCVDLTRQ